VDGRTLRFRLAGINNQNFIMSDEQTGSWWQQVTGCAFLGSMTGRCLEEAAWDEVTFAVWKQEHPETLVLLPDESVKKRYSSAEWEKKVARYPTVTPVDPNDGLEPRDLVVGVALPAASKAYPWTTIVAQNPILDWTGGVPLLLLLHPDGRSLRCFDRRVEGKEIELFLEQESDPPVLVDSATGTRWDFTGLATSGPLSGRRLARVTCLKDFWFDWKTYHPATTIFAAGMPQASD